MSTVRPFEIDAVAKHLRHQFTGKLPEASSGTSDQREQNFLSRALAAYAAQKLGNCSLDEAAASVVDGGGDGGIDAVVYNPNAHTLWLIQSKFIADGRGQPDLGDVGKFCGGVEALLAGEFDTFTKNAAWVARLPSIKSHFKNRDLKVRAALVYSGISVVADDRVRLFERLQQKLNHSDDYLTFSPYNLTTVADWVSGADQGAGVKTVDIEIHHPGWVRTPYETIFGLLKLSDLAALRTAHKNRLVAANIRNYIGATEVNTAILSTLREEPHHFLYLNNGLTAYCERMEVNNLDRADAAKKRLTAHGFSIVNGAQTLGSVHSVFDDANPTPDGFVFIKIISLERCAEDEAFARRITESTNFQNRIVSRDFAALDELQDRIASQLSLVGVVYHFKQSDDTPGPDAQNFTLLEATTALAALPSEAQCDLITRIIADRDALWSSHAVFTDEPKDRYRRVFRLEYSAHTVWRAVQTQRLVLSKLRIETSTASGVRKSFFENCRWLVLNMVFLKLHPERSELITLTDSEASAISEKTLSVAEVLWSICEEKGFVVRSGNPPPVDPYHSPRHFRSVFCAPNDCQELRRALFSKLA
jgi:hypothetical protein